MICSCVVPLSVQTYRPFLRLPVWSTQTGKARYDIYTVTIRNLQGTLLAFRTAVQNFQAVAKPLYGSSCDKDAALQNIIRPPLGFSSQHS